MKICCDVCGKGPREGELLFKTSTKTPDGETVDQFWCPAHLSRDSERYRAALDQLLDPDVRDALRRPIEDQAP